MGAAVNVRGRGARRWLSIGLLVGVPAGCDQIYADPITASAVPPQLDSGLTTTRTPPLPCTTRPVENAPCYRADSVCEYGDSPDLTCNTRFVCANDPAYGLYWTEQTRGTCASDCPGEAAIVDGAPCDLGDAGSLAESELLCSTAGGTCACTTGPDGLHVHGRRWVCVKPSEGCPDRRPLLGQPCFGEHACDYGSCELKHGARMICESDVWQVEARPCP
jgi:hypothetical protein